MLVQAISRTMLLMIETLPPPRSRRSQSTSFLPPKGSRAEDACSYTI